MNNSKKIKVKLSKRWLAFSIILGTIASLVFLFFIGTITDVVDNDLFARMIPATQFDLIILVLTSILIGVFISTGIYIHKLKLDDKNKSAKFALGGSGTTILAVACPICIKVFVWLFGAAFLMKYYNPIRPIIGILSIGLLAFAIVGNVKSLKRPCIDCDEEKTKKIEVKTSDE